MFGHMVQISNKRYVRTLIFHSDKEPIAGIHPSDKLSILFFSSSMSCNVLGTPEKNDMIMTDKNEGLVSSKTPATMAADCSSTSNTSAGASPEGSATQRLPAPEKPEAVKTRAKVIAAFWFIIIFLGFPMWWKTTSVYRVRLPVEQMAEWAGGKVCKDVSLYLFLFFFFFFFFFFFLRFH